MRAKEASIYCSHSLIPAITIRKSFVAQYDIWDGFRKSSRCYTPSSTKASGKLSAKARQRLSIALELLCSAAQTKRVWWPLEKRFVSFKVNFITLTLPKAQMHSDCQIVNQCLKAFLRKWRDQNPSLLYVWKSETQDNGNIHFHITSNSYIDMNRLRRMWCQALGKLDYIERACTRWPPCTEVKAVRNVDDICSYITAYVSKKDLYKKPLKRWHKLYDKKLIKSEADTCKLPKNYFSNLKRQVTCKLWDASKLLLIGACKIVMPASDICAELYHMSFDEARIKRLEFCTITSTKSMPASAKSALQLAYDEHIKDIRAKCKSATSLL